MEMGEKSESKLKIEFFGGIFSENGEYIFYTFLHFKRRFLYSSKPYKKYL
jgi:hypothetical protein